MDFIKALPKVGGKSIILTVLDCLSKYAHLIPLAHPYSVTTVAHKLFSEIVRLHGLPKSIVSDRDVIFASRFYQELFRLSAMKLQMTSAYHPQSDDQSEIVNKIITMYLRCFTGDRPKEWIRWLPWAEFCYNTAYHKSTRTTPFKLVYGHDPPQLKTYSPGDAAVPSVDDLVTERDQFLEQTKVRLQESQDYYNKYYDNKHTDRSFQVGDWVWLKLMA
jgi:transposase InsO family protein